MTKNDELYFAAIMKGFSHTFGTSIDANALALQFEVLKKFSINEIVGAIKSLIENWDKPTAPRIADIIRAMGGGEEVKVENALNEIMGMISWQGHHVYPKWNDPIVAKLLSTRWNYQSLCNMTEEQLKWWRKEFKEAYLVLSKEQTFQENQLKIPDQFKPLLENIGK